MKLKIAQVIYFELSAARTKWKKLLHSPYNNDNNNNNNNDDTNEE